MKLKYKRVLLKISGEMFSGDDEFGIDFDAAKEVAREINTIYKEGVEVAVVVGGGNIFRGRNVRDKEIDKATADYMGMISTMLNALAFQGVLEHFQAHNPDMLCVIRRKRGFFKKLWEKNSVLKRDFHTSIPLLILSGNL